MKSDTPIDDPCDGVSVEDLAGWTKYDSSGMRETINGKRLERDSGDRYQNSWVRLDNG